jgi:hypothetical protein
VFVSHQIIKPSGDEGRPLTAQLVTLGAAGPARETGQRVSFLAVGLLEPGGQGSRYRPPPSSRTDRLQT